MQLLKTQKNELFDIIEYNGLSPSMFQIEYSFDGEYTECWYKLETFEDGEPEYYFKIRKDSRVVFCPGIGSYKYSGSVGDWRALTNSFLVWLRALKEEISAVDKWQQLENELEKADINFDVGNERFTHKEYEEILSRMNVLKQGISDIPQINENLESINKRLDHLTEMVGELGKFDWRSLFAGTIAGILTQIGATPDNATKLWELVKITFSTIKLLN